MSYPLTKRQFETLQFIESFKNKNGFAPTLKEIGESTGANIGTAFKLVEHLIDKGYVKRYKFHPRGIEVLKLK